MHSTHLNTSIPSRALGFASISPVCKSRASLRVSHFQETIPRATSSNDNESLVSSSGDEIILPPPPNLEGKDPRKYYNAIALAFLGDGVWEMYVRRKFFYPPKKMAQYYASVIENVRAEAQAKAHDTLLDSDVLNEEEKSILKWGANATGTLPKRVTQDKLKTATYRAATAIECLVGYLYLTDQERLHTVIEFLDLN